MERIDWEALRGADWEGMGLGLAWGMGMDMGLGRGIRLGIEAHMICKPNEARPAHIIAVLN